MPIRKMWGSNTAWRLSYQWLGKFYEDKFEDLNQAQAYYRQSKNLLLELVSRFPGYV